MSDASESQMPIFQVVVLLLVVVAFGGWGFLASSYVGAQARGVLEMTEEELDAAKGGRTLPIKARATSVAYFLTNAADELPNFPQVMSWHFQNRIWLPITIAGVGLCVLIGGGILKQVDSQLHPQPRKRKRN